MLQNIVWILIIKTKGYMCFCGLRAHHKQGTEAITFGLI
jgi:hypothetical protein